MSLFANGKRSRGNMNPVLMRPEMGELTKLTEATEVKTYYLTEEEREKYKPVKKEGAKCRI